MHSSVDQELLGQPELQASSLGLGDFDRADAHIATIVLPADLSVWLSIPTWLGGLQHRASLSKTVQSTAVPHNHHGHRVGLLFPGLQFAQELGAAMEVAVDDHGVDF